MRDILYNPETESFENYKNNKEAFLSIPKLEVLTYNIIKRQQIFNYLLNEQCLNFRKAKHKSKIQNILIWNNKKHQRNMLGVFLYISKSWNLLSFDTVYKIFSKKKNLATVLVYFDLIICHSCLIDLVNVVILICVAFVISYAFCL